MQKYINFGINQVHFIYNLPLLFNAYFHKKQQNTRYFSNILKKNNVPYNKEQP